MAQTTTNLLRQNCEVSRKLDKNSGGSSIDLLTDQQTYTLITQLTNKPTINQPYMILFLFDWDMK